MPAKTNIFKNFKNDYFIETGSYLGDGIQFAIEAGFKNIISIELSDKYFTHCSNRFKQYPFVKIIQGDSADVLYDIIKDISVPITFWLDGHYSCGDTAKGKYSSPLIQELDQIKKQCLSTHTIIIDDVRCWRLPNPAHGFDLRNIFDKLKEINSAYSIEYLDGEEKNDILVAK